MPAIDKVQFATFCVRRADFYGVNPHYVVGVAQLRSKINDDKVGEECGPFRFTKEQWEKNRVNPEFQPDFLPDDILNWRMQCSVFGRMVHVELNKLINERGGQQPSALALYVAQLKAAGVTAIDEDAVARDLTVALQETSAAVIKAQADPLEEVQAPAAPPIAPEVILFRRVPSLASVKGHLIAKMQDALIQRGHLPAIGATGRPSNDGIFGPTTEGALEAFQSGMGHPSTGALTHGEWRELTGLPSPDIYERCAQITAAFEGTGFAGVNETDIDDTVLTFGYHGYTVAGGNLQLFLKAFDVAHPGRLDELFGTERAAALRTLFPPAVPTEQAVQRGRALFLSGNAVKQEWQDAFEKFGSDPQCQADQLDFSRREYWSRAEKMRASLKMSEPLSHALCFDVSVQNGDKTELAKATAQGFTPVMGEVEKRVRFGTRVVELAESQFQNDVRARKVDALGKGDGNVHGARYLLANWGFAAAESAESNDASDSSGPPVGNASFSAFFASKFPGLTAFSASEFLVKGSKHASNHLNTDPPQALWGNIIATVKVLIELKQRLGGAAITLNSAYRSPAYNASVGGARDSQHMKFTAVDLVAHDGGRPSDWARTLHQMRDGGFFKGGIGLYNSFVHVDTRGYNANWG
jgi:hypothetical protein